MFIAIESKIRKARDEEIVAKLNQMQCSTNDSKNGPKVPSTQNTTAYGYKIDVSNSLRDYAWNLRRLQDKVVQNKNLTESEAKLADKYLDGIVGGLFRLANHEVENNG